MGKAEDAEIFKDIVVIDIDDALDLPVKNWGWRSHFLLLEDCHHKLYLGRSADMQHVPQELIDMNGKQGLGKHHHAHVSITHGFDAYQHMLTVYTGLLDEHPGEKKTKETIDESWKAYTNPQNVVLAKVEERKQKYGQVISSMFADASAVRAVTFEDHSHGRGLRNVSLVRSVQAKHRAHLGSHSEILIIAGGDRKETLENIRGVDHKERDIFITHRDADTLRQLRQDIEALRNEGHIKAICHFVPFDDCMRTYIHGVSSTMSLERMDNGPRDKALLEAWVSQPNMGTLAHLHGLPGDDVASSEVWVKARATQPNGIILPEDLKEQYTVDARHNDAILADARHAIANCVESRRHGLRPVRQHLLDPADDYKGLVQGALSGGLAARTAYEAKAAAGRSGSGFPAH